MNNTDFIQAARALGVDQYSIFLTLPDVFSETLLVSAKRHARFLEKQFPSIGHRKMLEVVAKAAGFADWHAFQTSASRLKEEYAPSPAGSRPAPQISLFKPFMTALPLLIRVPKDVMPTTEAQHGLDVLCRRLALPLATSERAVLDVLAKLQGADSWDQLCNRTPESSTSPLYQFSSHGRTGEFRWSSTCEDLVEELDELWQDYESLSKPEQQEARQFIIESIRKHPDFLEGLLMQATMEEEDGELQKAGHTFHMAIQMAEKLIPPEFNGKISWDVIENRFYHRLLYYYMRWCAVNDNLRQAISLARQQLRLNPDDNLGVRIDLPALLAGNGDHKAAATAMRSLKKGWPDAHVGLVLGLCHLAGGEISTGQEWFLRALFELPAIRPAIAGKPIPDTSDSRWYHGMVPAFDSLLFDYDTVCIQNPDVERMCMRIMRDPAVVEAETHADTLYRDTIKELRDSHGGDQVYERWKLGAKQLAVELVALHGKRWAAIINNQAEMG